MSTPARAAAATGEGDADTIFIAAGAPLTGPGDTEPDQEFWVDAQSCPSWLLR